MKLKYFFKVFSILFITELAIGIGDIFAYSYNYELFGLQLHKLTRTIVHIISLPASLLGREYPFYAGGFLLSLILFIINVLLHTIVVYYVFKFISQLKNN